MRAKVSLFCALSGLIGALVLRSSFSDTASELAKTTSNPSSIKLEETHTAKIMAAPAAPAVQDKPLKVLVLEPESKKVDASIIWLHGLGDEGPSWKIAFTGLRKLASGLRVVLPTAPVQPVTLNGGMKGTSWHDIKTLRSIDTEDFKGLDESADKVRKLIKAEIDSGIPSSRVFLGGFSQGAAMSLYVGVSHPQQLGGIVALSGYLPYTGDVSKLIHETNAKTPIFIGHGDADGVVSIRAGHHASDTLQKAGCAVTYNVYPGLPHSVSPKETRDVQDFVASKLTAK